MPSKSNALESILAAGVVISSDTGEYKTIAPFNPTDATSNPSLVYAAVSQPEYSHLVDDALTHAMGQPGSTGDVGSLVDNVMDLSLVNLGIEILRIIPGRVSMSVDPRLASSVDAIVAKATAIIKLFEERGYKRTRVLIKIPATPEGIRAAHILEAQTPRIHTNMTLIFSTLQSIACAQAGVSVLSPFVGRVLDWHRAQGALKDSPLASHPGLLLVKSTRAVYDAHGYSTEIMAAGFRGADEVVELVRTGGTATGKGFLGPHIFTLPPSILQPLREQNAFAVVAGTKKLGLPEMKTYFSDGAVTEAYLADVAAERIAVDKVPEGIEKFSVDARKLEADVRAKILNAM